MKTKKHGRKENTPENSIFFFNPHEKLSLENQIQMIKLKLPFLINAPFNGILVTPMDVVFRAHSQLSGPHIVQGLDQSQESSSAS